MCVSFASPPPPLSKITRERRENGESAFPPTFNFEDFPLIAKFETAAEESEEGTDIEEEEEEKDGNGSSNGIIAHYTPRKKTRTKTMVVKLIKSCSHLAIKRDTFPSLIFFAKKPRRTFSKTFNADGRMGRRRRRKKKRDLNQTDRERGKRRSLLHTHTHTYK